ncbi:MAG: hypothetical protein ACYS9C_00440 [Planctomycetota bacterium]
MECDMSGEEENPTAGKKRLIGHRRKYRIRLETQLPRQSRHLVSRDHVVVRTMVRMAPLIGAGLSGLSDNPSRSDADTAGMQHAQDFFLGRRMVHPRRHPHGVGQI